MLVQLCTVCTNSQATAISLVQMIRTLLEDLPGIFAETAITQCVVGAALQVAEKLLVRYTLPLATYVYYKDILLKSLLTHRQNRK